MLGTLIRSTVPRCLSASTQRAHVLSSNCCSLVVPGVAAGPWGARQSQRCYSNAETSTSAPTAGAPAPKKYNLRPISKGMTHAADPARLVLTGDRQRPVLLLHVSVHACLTTCMFTCQCLTACMFPLKIISDKDCSALAAEELCWLHARMHAQAGVMLLRVTSSSYLIRPPWLCELCKHM
jgi:hypothetical protein